MKNPVFRFVAHGPLSRRPGAWAAWRDVITGALHGALALAAVLALAWYSGLAWSQDNATPCWAWGGSNSSSQGQFIKCPQQPPVVVQVPGPVREVKVPVPVPGPVRVERVEVPVQPAKKVRD